ncbi:hypothetical protein BDN71DRAFT_1451363 [Pleurotus eryngii]|uniref:Uncharacterized protein n=1 Tax=Pleurotus eryngii TaxID=5323 RepID=A0A9P5ZSS5_PLEER|nr:hypothetical protein BDN71DRAFT_1451363 [Pleurotus eryngii]
MSDRKRVAEIPPRALSRRVCVSSSLRTPNNVFPIRHSPAQRAQLCARYAAQPLQKARRDRRRHAR